MVETADAYAPEEANTIGVETVLSQETAQGNNVQENQDEEGDSTESWTTQDGNI
jgi:hypothetical protein